MLSYQHAYHAGCLADVHKHSYLLAVLNRLRKDDTKIHYIETHAGRGLYNLTSKESLKTGEAKAGILTVLKNPSDSEKPLCELISKLDEGFYPGSPTIASLALRETDSIHLAEKHKQEAKALRQNMADFKQVQIANKDGYEFVAKLNVSRHQQKLVLIDPSFEIKEEYEQAADFIIQLHQKWPEAHIMLWYPKLKNNLHLQMIEKLTSALPQGKVEEHDWSSPEQTDRMYGTGLFLINL